MMGLEYQRVEIASQCIMKKIRKKKFIKSRFSSENGNAVPGQTLFFFAVSAQENSGNHPGVSLLLSSFKVTGMTPVFGYDKCEERSDKLQNLILSI